MRLLLLEFSNFKFLFNHPPCFNPKYRHNIKKTSRKIIPLTNKTEQSPHLSFDHLGWLKRKWIIPILLPATKTMIPKYIYSQFPKGSLQTAHCVRADNKAYVMPVGIVEVIAWMIWDNRPHLRLVDSHSIRDELYWCSIFTWRLGFHCSWYTCGI